MTTFIKNKFKKSDDQTNTPQYELFHVKMSKTNMFKMGVLTFWSELQT